MSQEEGFSSWNFCGFQCSGKRAATAGTVCFFGLKSVQLESSKDCKYRRSLTCVAEQPEQQSERHSNSESSDFFIAGISFLSDSISTAVVEIVESDGNDVDYCFCGAGSGGSNSSKLHGTHTVNSTIGTIYHQLDESPKIPIPTACPKIISRQMPFRKRSFGNASP